MITSYQFAERYNAQSILHGAWLALVAVVVFLAKLETYMLIAVVGGAVGLGLFAVISAIPANLLAGPGHCGRFRLGHLPTQGGEVMQIRDIVPTLPTDALITVRTENGMVEIEIDNRDDLVRVQLDAHKAAVLMAALSSAMAIIAKQKKGVQP